MSHPGLTKLIRKHKILRPGRDTSTTETTAQSHLSSRETKGKGEKQFLAVIAFYREWDVVTQEL